MLLHLCTQFRKKQFRGYFALNVTNNERQNFSTNFSKLNYQEAHFKSK